jgi:hypothetical protein
MIPSKKYAAGASQRGMWLPGMDSNHDNIKLPIMCNLQALQWSKMPNWTRSTTIRTQLVHGRSWSAAKRCLPDERLKRRVVAKWGCRAIGPVNK